MSDDREHYRPLGAIRATSPAIIARVVGAPGRASAVSGSRVYAGVTDDDLSCHFGLELTYLGAKHAWPAPDMTVTNFGKMVAAWIVETGRQSLTLEQIAECIKRGEQKCAD